MSHLAGPPYASAPEAPADQPAAARPPLRRLPQLWPGVLLCAGLLLAGPAGLLAVAALIAAAVVAAWLVGAANPPTADPFRWWRQRRARVSVEPDFPGFAPTRSALEWGLRSPFDFEVALRPRLQRVLAARLAARAHVDLHRDPQRGRAEVGDDVAWELLDPTRQGDRRRDRRGPPADVISRVLDRLERL